MKITIVAIAALSALADVSVASKTAPHLRASAGSSCIEAEQHGCRYEAPWGAVVNPNGGECCGNGQCNPLSSTDTKCEPTPGTAPVLEENASCIAAEQHGCETKWNGISINEGGGECCGDLTCNALSTTDSKCEGPVSQAIA